MEQADLDNRFTQHVADPNKTQLMNTVRNVVKAAADAINTVAPEGREKTLSIAHLEEAMYWANAGIARHVESQPEGA
jgi:hypothetical protein